MDKTSLRQKYKALRSDISLDQVDELSLQIANQSLKLDIWDFEFYHIFLAIENQKKSIQNIYFKLSLEKTPMSSYQK